MPTKNCGASRINPAKHTMKTTKIERTANFFRIMGAFGFSYSEAQTLRRAEMTLQRWFEKECGDSNNHRSWAIERDETTDKPFMVVHPHQSGSKSFRYAIADRETGACKRIEKILSFHPELWFYVQTDPRGCALYVGRKTDLLPGVSLDCQNTRGFAVCI